MFIVKYTYQFHPSSQIDRVVSISKIGTTVPVKLASAVIKVAGCSGIFPCIPCSGASCHPLP
jgi:hypothetical protein